MNTLVRNSEYCSEICTIKYENTRKRVCKFLYVQSVNMCHYCTVWWTIRIMNSERGVCAAHGPRRAFVRTEMKLKLKQKLVKFSTQSVNTRCQLFWWSLSLQVLRVQHYSWVSIPLSGCKAQPVQFVCWKRRIANMWGSRTHDVEQHKRR